LSIDDGQAAFFSLRGVDQHPFHRNSLSFSFAVRMRTAFLRPTWAKDTGRRRAKNEGELPRSLVGPTEGSGTDPSGQENGRGRVEEASERLAGWSGGQRSADRDNKMGGPCQAIERGREAPKAQKKQSQQ
jgi:hypothetical protein